MNMLTTVLQVDTIVLEPNEFMKLASTTTDRISAAKLVYL